MVVGEFTQEIDLLVIGGGPGGYTAAFRASALGVSTMIVDSRDALGGVCLHEGCVPSKAMLHAAEVIQLAEHAERFGVSFGAPSVDFDTLGRWVAQTVGRLAGGLEHRAKKYGARRITGRASFEDSRHVAIPGSEAPRVKFKHAIIATGTVARSHPVLPFDGTVVLRPTDATTPRRAPATMLIVGSGYMAVEAAVIWAALGTRITLVSPEPRLLPEVDADLLRPLERRLKSVVEEIAIGVDIGDATVTEHSVAVRYEGGSPPARTEFDAAIVAIGQDGATADLNLGAVKVTPAADGCLDVDEQLRTMNPRILAVGDVTGHPMLADRAIHQARIAAEAVADWGSAFDARVVPKVIFTDPQIAWCGLTQAEAEREGIAHAVRKLPWGASGRAAGMGRMDGVTKLIHDPDTKLILGVGITGPHAGELIAEGCLAIEMGAELIDLARTIHPHPTLSELLSDAAAADE
jgi:dihydrolipoamide dehydrogenase